MSRPRHIRDARRDREARREAWEAGLDGEDIDLRKRHADDMRRRAAQSPAEREAAARRLFDKWGTPCLAVSLLVFGEALADTLSRSI